MKSQTWRDKYTEPKSENGSLWVLPSNEEILNDYRSFGGCFLPYLTGLSEHAGWQRVFLVQLFERLLSDQEFYQSFSQVHLAGQCADVLMTGIAQYTQAAPCYDMVEAPIERAPFDRGH